MADANAVADAARIASLEEEVLLARERARSEGDELENLRRQVREAFSARCRENRLAFKLTPFFSLMFAAARQGARAQGVGRRRASRACRALDP